MSIFKRQRTQLDPDAAETRPRSRTIGDQMYERLSRLSFRQEQAPPMDIGE